MALPFAGLVGGAARVTGGAVAADLIVNLAQKLIGAGFSQDQAVQLLSNPQTMRALAGQPADNAMGGLASWAGDISKAAAGSAIQSATAPAGSIDAGISSKYFISPSLGMEYELKSSPELFRREVLRKFGVDVPELASQEELLAEAQRRNVEMAESLTEREIAKIRAQREYDVINQALQSEAQIRTQQVKSLGDVQSQRVQSGYDYAKNILQSAINNVYERAKLENSPVLQEIAKVQ